MTEPASRNKAFVAGAKPPPRSSRDEGRAHGVLRTHDPVPPPTLLQSLLPVFGSVAEAGYEFNHDHPWLGVADMGAAAADGASLTDPAVWGARAVRDMTRRGLEKHLALSWTHRAVRGRLQTAGFVRKAVKEGLEKKPAQELHHAIIPHGGWGKAVPDWIKNSSWNLKALEQETHRRIHTAFGGKPRFNPIGRTWVGAPGYVKKDVAAVAGHAVLAHVDHTRDQSHGR